MAKVSIIVPIYGVEKYIEKCARSLFEQTFEDIEYIFVNDATPDKSIDILYSVIKDYPKKSVCCKIINHKTNKGLTAARNSGLKNATGDYIIHCDSDDWMENNMIENLYLCALENKADIVTCDFRMVYKDKNINYTTVNWTSDKVQSLKNYISYCWTVIWNMLVKHDIYKKNKIKSLEGYSYGEDFNLSVKLLLNAHKIVHLNKVLYNYNQTNISSIMRSLNKKTMSEEQIMYLDVIDYLKRRGEYSNYEKQLCWRVLKSKQEMILDINTYSDFLQFYPESHRYILSCPYLNIKLKIMMWSLTHHLSYISRLMLLFRHLKHGC